MPKTPWDMTLLRRPPAVRPAVGFRSRGLRAIFYDGPAFQGRPTRVFAWLGLPDVPAGRKAPGIVLVHGGAGSAFARWVRQWVRRGYAAIAMDTCGCVPLPGRIAAGQRHDAPGPAGWGGLDQVDRPVADQWPWHAVADVILGHSLLRSLPQVDSRRIGLMGISWGGYLAGIVPAVDRRLRFGVCVYGCGFLGPTPDFDGFFAGGDEAKKRAWLGRWDPKHFLPRCRTPMLWITGTNDIAFPLSSLRASYRAAPGPHTLCVKVRMKHNYGTPWRAKEIAAFADGILGRGSRLVQVVQTGRGGRRAWVRFRSQVPVVTARLCYSREGGRWIDRRWLVRAAELDARQGLAAARLPDGARAYYLNLIDDRGLIVSTPHVTLDPPRRKTRSSRG